MFWRDGIPVKFVYLFIKKLGNSWSLGEVQEERSPNRAMRAEETQKTTASPTRIWARQSAGS